MTNKPDATGYRWSLALRQLTSISTLAMAVFALAAAEFSRSALAADTGSSSTPAACSSLTSPGTFQNIDGPSDDIFISGFVAGATVTVAYRNNRGGGSSYQATVTQISSLGITPAGAGPTTLGNNQSGSTTFSHVSGSGTLQLRVAKSSENNSPDPEYRVICAPPPPGLTLSKSTLSVSEAGTTSDTLTVRLATQPTADVTVAVSSNDASEGAITTPTTLTFTAINWNTAQNVTLQAVNDSVDDGDIAYNVVLNPGGSDTNYNALANTNVSATTADDDTAGLTLSKSTLSVNEAGTTSDTLTVRLATQPTTNVTVAVSSGDTSEGTITTPTTLTFTDINWNTPQNVTLQAVNDSVDDGDIAYNVVLNPGGSDTSYSALANTNVGATTVDDDTAGLTLSKSTLSVNEAGTTSDTLTVRLATQPTTNVTVAVSSGDTSEGTITTPTTLTFTDINWNTPQNVTLQAVNDSVDDGDIAYNVVLNPGGSDTSYSALANTNVGATTVDDDTAGLTLSKSTLSVNEAGTTSDTLTVRLATQPTTNVTVAVSSGDTSEGTITTPTTLTFTDINWNTPQNVTLQAVNDNVDDGDITYNVVLNPASGSDTLYNGLPNTNVGATTVDDDTRGVTVSPTTVSATEGAVTGTFTVVLTSQPTAGVTISLTPGAQCSLSSSGLTFTTANWSAAQPVTVTAVNDAVVEGAHVCSITTGDATGGDYAGFVVADVTANITDNDTATASIDKPADGDGAEPGDDGAFTVTLSAASATATVVNFTPGGTAQAGGDYTALSGSVTVPAGATTATIPVDVLDDLTVEGTETVSVSLDGTSNGLISASGSASLDIADNDTATASIAKPADGDGAEPGDDGAFTVTLSAASATATVVNFTPGGTAQAGGDYTALSGSVTVPAGATTATIPVDVLDDLTVEGTETVSVSLDGTSNGLISASGSASLDIADNDTATASIAKPADGDGAEPGDDGAFTVTLSAASATATVVNFTPGGTAQAGGDYTALSGSVTVPAGATTATIPVDVLDDLTVEGTETVSVSLDGTSNGLISASGSASLDIADNDTATASIAKPADGDGAEPGDDGAFTVTLSAASATATVVNFTPGGTAQAGGDYTALSGSVTVPAGATTATIPVDVLDDLTVEGTETVSVSLDGTSNGLISASGSASLDIADEDVAAVTVTESEGETGVSEGGATDSFALVLNAQPTADVSIALSSDAQCTLSASSLTFTSANWNVAQSVTVTAVDDPAVEGAHVCAVTTGDANGDGFTGVTVADVTAEVTDNDTASVTVDGALQITEGGATDSFTVVLSAQPTADVSIALEADTQCSLSAGSVNFTPANWNSPQSVTVTAVDDIAIEGAHSCAITTGDANGDGFTGVMVADVTADVTDNDVAGVSVEGAPAIAEGGAAGSFTIALTAPPTADVSILFAPDAQCTLSTSGLTFTSANWSSPQSVTVTAVDDSAGEGSHSCTITTGSLSSADNNYNGLAVADVIASVADNDAAAAPDETLVQKTFESETQNFMAARMRLLARLGPRTHRMANRERGSFQPGSNGFNIQGENGNLVGDFALNSAAVQRMIRGDFLNVTPAAGIAEASGPVNAWIEGQFAYYKSEDDDEGDADGNYFVGYAGVDVRIYDGVAIGIMGQLDWFDEDGDTGKTDGDGWMIGPYLSAELAPNLFLDLRGMYGQSNNSSTQQIQNFEYQGDFDTERLLLEIVLSGRFDYGGAVLTPDLQLIYIWDDQQDYSVSNGADVVDVDGQLVKLGQLSSGLKVAQKWDADGAEIWPYLGGRMFWDFDNPGALEIDGGTVSTDEIRAAVSVGIDVGMEDTQISIEATYDGLFTDDYESIGGRLSIGHRF